MLVDWSALKINVNLKNIIKIYKENAHIVIYFLGIKMSFKNLMINQLEDCCCISNLNYFKEQGVRFKHPVGIVIHPDVKIGKNCTIYQNVTIGYGKRNKETNRRCPVIGNNVKIYANSVLIGGITIGDNSIIGAGAVVISSVPKNSLAVGVPAKIVERKTSIK